MTDEEIIKLVVLGDSEKYGEIINRYEKRLKAFVRKIIGNNLEIDDIVEDSLINAYQNLKGFDPKLKFSSWILRIAHNKTVDYIKKKKPKLVGDDEITNYELRITNENEKLIEDLEIKKENSRELYRAIENLELKYKEVIVLYFFEEKSYEEISDILQTTVSNVGVMINRGKNKLRINLKLKT